jgi:hypothetical protein
MGASSPMSQNTSSGAPFATKTRDCPTQLLAKKIVYNVTCWYFIPLLLCLQFNKTVVLWTDFLSEILFCFQEGILMLEMVKDHKRSTTQGCSVMQRGSYVLNIFSQIQI